MANQQARTQIQLFLTIQDNKEKEKKYQQFQRLKSPRERPLFRKVTTSSKRLVLSDDKGVYDNDIKKGAIRHERDVNIYTGFSTIALFKTVFSSCCS